jgi:hypothetical protein
MKTLRNSILVLFCLFGTYSFTNLNVKYHFIDYPAKTIVIKNPMASNINTFFSSNKMLEFEIYKVGSPEDLRLVLQNISNNKYVMSCNSGSIAGDFTHITLALKSNKDKACFISVFKKAGLGFIKINQAEVIAIEKL